MPPPGALTRHGRWTRTWAGADPRVSAHFCRVSEAKEAASRATHRSAPKTNIPGQDHRWHSGNPQPLSFSSSQVPSHSTRILTQTRGTHPRNSQGTQCTFSANGRPQSRGCWLWPGERTRQACGVGWWLFGGKTEGPRNLWNGLEVWASALCTMGVSPCERGITGWRRPVQGPRKHRARVAPHRGSWAVLAVGLWVGLGLHL